MSLQSQSRRLGRGRSQPILIRYCFGKRAKRGAEKAENRLRLQCDLSLVRALNNSNIVRRTRKPDANVGEVSSFWNHNNGVKSSTHDLVMHSVGIIVSIDKLVVEDKF